MRSAGVRARQEGVVFVMCENEDLVERSVRPLLGSWVTLDASAASVTLQPADKGQDEKQVVASKAAQDTPAAAAKPSAIKMVRILECGSFWDAEVYLGKTPRGST